MSVQPDSLLEHPCASHTSSRPPARPGTDLQDARPVAPSVAGSGVRSGPVRGPGTMDSAAARSRRVLSYHAVDMLDRGLLCDDELLAAKALGHDLASETGNDAMQLHAANGLDEDFPIQRVWRDLQTTYAPAGTGEVQRQRLAENLLQQEEDGVSTRTPWSVLHAGRAQPPVTVQPVSV
ncbi:acyl-CoA dehydrogenase family protein [Streptomyces sp. CGMCC 4.7035]|nr:acyl-CoA dehydrogenase family protein [Streptomyces sp. CGMCC 4.7035]WNB99155.1 acyl-CoA dehydrogenase family protein [Streptomyces sp. CGMCC 4.7035]